MIILSSLALLNDGYAAGGVVWRCEGENNEVKEFAVFAPVAIAQIKRPTQTLLSRSIEIRMVRKTRDEQIANFRGDRPDPELAEVQRKFARAAIDYGDALGAADPIMGDLINRDADNYRPLFAICDLAGGNWPKRIREIALHAMSIKADQSTKELLLADIRAAYKAKGTDRLSSERLVEYLVALDDRPWSEWKGGKPLTKAGLARLLTPFNILSGTVRLDTEHTLKGYHLAAFSEAFERHLPPESVTTSQPYSHGHRDASQNVTTTPPVTFSKTSQPYSHGHCDVVTLSDPPSSELAREIDL